MKANHPPTISMMELSIQLIVQFQMFERRGEGGGGGGGDKFEMAT